MPPRPPAVNRGLPQRTPMGCTPSFRRSWATADCLNKIMANRLPTRITALAGQSGDKLVPADLTLKKRAGAENCYDFSAALLTAADSTAAAQVSGTITMVKEDGRWKASAITLNL